MLKNAQGFGGLAELPPSTLKTVINKKNQTLEEKIIQVKTKDPSKQKTYNIGIHLKREKYSQRGNLFFQLNNRQIYSNRQGFATICPKLSRFLNDLFLAEQDKSALITLLKTNKKLIKENKKEIIAICLYSSLTNAFSSLETIDPIKAKDLSLDYLFLALQKNNLPIFKLIFPKLKMQLSDTEMTFLKREITNYGTREFIDYFAQVSSEYYHVTPSCVML